MANLMTLDETADYLRVTQQTIHRLLERSAIPATKVGRQWRFDKSTIDLWLHRNSVGTPTKKARILIIDDDETICTLFKDTLEEEGHVTETATESSRGLELAQDKDYDLVFLDLKMPRTDGAELFRQIKAVKPELPVTIITGYPESDLMSKALDYGPFSVMKKPFRSSDIISAVESYIHFSKR